MQEYKIILTWEAIYDAAEIAEYIEENFSLRTADTFQQNLQKEFNKILSNAKLFAPTHILYRGYHIYKRIFKPSLIFYIIKEAEKEVHILRTLRGERDWEHILKNSGDYTYPEK